MSGANQSGTCGRYCFLPARRSAWTWAALTIALFARSAMAINPNTGDDDNDGTGDGDISLREAIAASNPGDVLQLDPIDYKVSGTFGQITIDKTLTIKGWSQSQTFITRIGPNSRIFRIENDANNNDILVQIEYLTIRNGATGGSAGAGLIVGDGNFVNDSLPALQMLQCTVRDCTTASGDGGAMCIERDAREALFVECTFDSNRANGTGSDGGGVRVLNATANFVKCTVSNNFCGRDGGGLFADAGLAVLTMTNCTVSGNRANRYGGGIGVSALSYGALTNCTITNNTCDADNAQPSGQLARGDGGGIACIAVVQDTTFLKNTIVAGNFDNTTSGSNPTVHPDISAIGGVCFRSQGNNLVGKNNGASGDFPAGNPNANGDLVGTSAMPIDPLLGPLAYNGGVTQTHALLSGSPAIDPNTVALRGGGPSATCLGLDTLLDPNDPYPILIDQRNVARPQGTKCDIGSFEYGDCNMNDVDDLEELTNPPDLRGSNPLDVNGNGVLDSCEGLCCIDGQTEIVLALDVSASIDDTELAEEINGLKWCLSDPTIIPRNGKVRIGVVIYGQTAYDLTGGLVTINSMADVDDIGMDLMGLLTDRIVSPVGTNTGGALQLARGMLAGGTENDNMLLIGDGKSNIGPNISDACYDVAADGILLCSIAVSADIAGQTELQDCAAATGGKFALASGMGFPYICQLCLGEATSPCLLTSKRCADIGGAYKGDGTDNDPPVMSCPPIMVECAYGIIPTPATMDECPDLLVFTYSDYAMTVTPCANHVVQNIMRAWTVMDQCGETGTCVQQITVVDTTPPYFTYCPPDITVPFGASTDCPATGMATAEDACSGVMSVTFEDVITPGECTAGYRITRTWTAKDNCGNTNSGCVQMITVSGPSRVQYHLKADLFVWPLIRIRWDNKNTPSTSDDTALEDTFISVINDDSTAHWVKFYFVDGRSWRFTNRTLVLTANQPFYFSAYRGMGGSGILPAFVGLHPEGYDANPATAQDNERILEGFIVGWTVDNNNRPYGSNQIASSATLVCYDREAAWEYKPWGYRSLFDGVKPDTSKLRLNGLMGEYQASPCCLLVDFFAAGTGALCPYPGSTCTQDFELSLLNMVMDFRAMPDHDLDGVPGEFPTAGGDTGDSEPPTTAVSVLTWNEAEVEVSNTVRCVTCWDSKLASAYGFGGAASPFAQSTLQTAKGKGRLCGSAAQACDRIAGNPHGQVLIYGKQSKDLPIVGVSHKILSWSGGGVEKASQLLVPIGDRTDGFITFDQTDQGPPPTIIVPGAGSLGSDAEGSSSIRPRSR